jgi:secernin
MCDTFVALQNKTQDGSVIFGKNSDREPNEAHEILIMPAQDYAAGEKMRCTYLEIPQVRHTNAVLLGKPFWMWGAEMGLNEHGLAIGNEALFTRLPYEKGPGLTGMDLLRLALERAKTAREGLEVITGLLSQYGQGGNCGFTHPFFYHNGFLLADPGEAWVLETAGKEWAAEKVHSVRSISNVISIGSDRDLSSKDLVRTALEHGWCKQEADFSFSRDYSDFLYTRFGAAKYRQGCTSRLLNSESGGVSLTGAMNILRSHGEKAGSTWAPDRALAGAEVCMHAGFGPVRINQSTGSMIVQFKDGQSTAWVTATSAPCTGIFKPVWLRAGLPWQEPSPTGMYSEECLWWRHERLHRQVIGDYPGRMGSFAQERNDLEASFVKQCQHPGLAVQELSELSRACFREAEAAEARWVKAVETKSTKSKNVFYFDLAWKEFNRLARMEPTP